MMKITARSGVLVLALATALALAPAPSQAIAPALLFLVKQIAQQTATSMIKDALLSSLSGMGCKGLALQKAIAAFDLRGGAGGGAGMLGGMLGGGMPQLPAGMAMPGLPAGMALPNLPAGAGLAAGGVTQMAGMPPDVAAKMKEMMPGAGMLPPGMAMDSEQMAMMAQLQQAMSQPLSPGETLATIDQLAELGFLPRSFQTELRECMVLVPEAAPALGMGMAMFKPMLPQLQQARAELHALSPAEQDEVVAALVEQIKPLPADERAAMLEHLGSGFFPPRVSAGVKAALAAR